MVALTAPSAAMMSLPRPVLIDQSPEPPTEMRLLPPPATTVPDPEVARNVRSVRTSDRIVSPAAPLPSTTAGPGLVTRSIV